MFIIIKLCKYIIYNPRRANEDKEGDVLRYGSPFALTHTSHSQQTLFLSSPSGSVLHSGRGSRRQEVLLEPTSTIHSAWVIHPLKNEDRILYYGYPVEVCIILNVTINS